MRPVRVGGAAPALGGHAGLRSSMMGLKLRGSVHGLREASPRRW